MRAVTVKVLLGRGPAVEVALPELAQMRVGVGSAFRATTEAIGKRTMP
jgi:hypothetical protein